MDHMQPITLGVIKISLEHYQKNCNNLLINKKSNLQPLFWNHIPFHTLVELVNSENITNENNRTLDLLLQKHFLTSKLESQKLTSEIYKPNPQIVFTQTTYAKNRE